MSRVETDTGRKPCRRLLLLNGDSRLGQRKIEVVGPKTRGLEASEAEEDAKFVRAALKEPSKFMKRAVQKLKQDYGRGEDSDEEAKLFYSQPPYDDEETEVKPGTKRKRGGGRRNTRRKFKPVQQDAVGEGEEIKKHVVSARLAALLKEELAPRIVPYNGSKIEYKQVWFKIGDVVSTQKEETKYYAQILAFHTDQYCERYISLQWLIPRYKFNPEDPHQPPITIESFRGAIPVDDPVSMKCFNFVLRPPAHYFQPENPHTVTPGGYYIYNNQKHSFDSPSSTLTSAEKRY